MNEKNLTIGDLIEVPEVQTVIRLEQGKTHPGEISGSFVFTREVAAHFTVITGSLLKKKGQGYFLQGDFGSGKSHFLACLYTALEYGKTLKGLHQSHGGIKRVVDADLRLLPVDISLIRFRARTSLEQIIILSIENSLLERGVEANLTPLSNFLLWLKTLLADPGYADSFKREFHLEDSPYKNNNRTSTNVEERDLPAWIDENPKQAYRHGMLFIKQQGLSSPELLVEDRHETFSRALHAIKDAGFSGMFLIIDELSEFFRSKPDTHSLNEDARTLQYLGEMSQEQPLWIIAAVQESIEKTGDIAQGTFRKIKDRFPVKLVLSTLHIRALISERLVHLKPGAPDKLHRIYEEFTKQFTTFSLPYNEFRLIYPVHPAAISLLDGLGDLFSVHRGIVDFVHSQIAGDRQRNIGGILHRPAMELLAPDSIFDHFENRISEFSDFHIYPRHILPHLKEVIDTVIEEENDRVIALRLVKILILYTIHPAKEEPTVRELTELVSCTTFGRNPDLNVRFIMEGILDPLVNASRFLAKLPVSSGNPLDTVYTIVREDNPGKLLKKRIESKQEELKDDDSRLILIPLAELEESMAWPGPEVLERGIVRSFEWLQSNRTVFIRFIIHPNKKTIDEYYYDFEERQSDFGLIITTAEKQINIQHIAVWQVPLHHVDMAVFKEYVAAKLVQESLKPGNPADEPIITLAEEKCRGMQLLIRNSLVDIIYTGRFSGKEIETNPVIKQVKYFDRIIESAGKALLSLRYPGFKRIAPQRVSPAPRNYQRVLDEFIVPGSILIRDARAKGLDDAINGLAVPLGFVELKSGTYIFSPSIAEYPFLSDFFGLLKASSHTPVEIVRNTLRSGEYGLPDNMFSFLIAALACAGLISLLRSGRTIPVDTLSLISVQKAEAIAPGELISKADRETLMKECHFLATQGIWDSFGLPAQREVWKSAIQFKENIQNICSGVKEMLKHYAGYSAFMFFDQRTIERKVEALIQVSDEIKISYPAKEGLERFLRAWRGSGLIQDDVGFIRKFHRFVKNQVKSFMFIYHYINYKEVEKAAQLDMDCKKLKDIVVALLKKPEVSVIGDEGKQLGNVFEHFRDYYSQFYIKNHDEYYASYEKRKLSKYAKRAINTVVLLSEIKSLDRPPGFNRLQGIPGTGTGNGTDTGAGKVCERRTKEELQSSPFCSCGYHLGDTPEQQNESPEQLIEHVLHEYIAILNTPGIRESIIAWAYAIQDKDPRMSKQLTSFCKALQDEKLTPASLLDFLGQEIIFQLKKALTGTVTLEPRNTDLLLSRLSGRRLPGNRIKEIVEDWLQSDDENTIFSCEGGIQQTVRDSHSTAAWWPLLHADLFPSGLKNAAPYNLDKDRLEKELEQVYPSSRVKKELKHLTTDTLIRFALGEQFHYHVIYKAWQLVCERILCEEKWPGDIPVKSRFMTPEKAGHIEESFSILKNIAGYNTLPFPGQLITRLSLSELVSHPYTTDELKDSVFRLLQKWEKTCEDWAETLPPVPRINLDNNPVVIICDGVSADVWMKATETHTLFYESGEVSLFRLNTRPVTVDAISGLFGFPGDPLDEFYKRNIQYISLKGNEETSITDHIQPLSKLTIVVRLNNIDRAGHEGRMDLKDMTAHLKAICDTQLYALYEICKKEKRKLIMTVDHGFSFSRNGLSHGQGGIFERIIPFAEWEMG